jgi:RasGEF domain
MKMLSLDSKQQQSIVDLITTNGFELNTCLTILYPAISIFEPSEFLDLLIDQFDRVQEIDKNSPQLWRILLFLQDWMSKYWVDFNLKMSFSIRFLVDGIVNENLADQFGIDLYRMSERPILKGTQDWGTLTKVKSTDLAQAEPFKQGSCNWFIQYEFNVIANQLVLIEYDLFVKIDPRDFLQDIWGKTIVNNGIRKMGAYTAHLSDIVKTTILLQNCRTIRAKVFLRFVKITKYLESLRCYNSLAAIIEGLQHSSVWGLKATLETAIEADAELFNSISRLSKITSPVNCFEAFRAAYKLANTPCIPLVTAVKNQILNQCKFACPNKEGSFEDISYLIEMGDTLALFESFKTWTHPFEQNLSLQNDIKESAVMNEEHCLSTSINFRKDAESISRSAIDGYSTGSPSVWFN